MSVPRSCQEAVDLLWEYVRDGLDPQDATVVEGHLAHCLRCCGELAFARELQARLAGPAPSLPDDVETRLTAFLEGLAPSQEGLA